MIVHRQGNALYATFVKWRQHLSVGAAQRTFTSTVNRPEQPDGEGAGLVQLQGLDGVHAVVDGQAAVLGAVEHAQYQLIFVQGACKSQRWERHALTVATAVLSASVTGSSDLRVGSSP